MYYLEGSNSRIPGTTATAQIFAGFGPDWGRWHESPSGRPPHSATFSSTFTSRVHPYATSSTDTVPKNLGSPLDGLNIFTCDGSGHWTSYTIDPVTFSMLCSRNNTKPIDKTKTGW